MTILLAILLVAVAFAFWARRKGEVWAGPVLAVLSALALVVGVWTSTQSLRKPSPIELAIHVQAGAARALGEKVAAAVSEGEILVLSYAPTPGEKLFTDHRLDGLRMALSNGAYRLTVAGPAVAPGSGPGSDFTVFAQERLAAEANAWLAAHPQVKAIVSLMPTLPPGLAHGGRPLFAFAVADLQDWSAGLRGGGWKAAMINRRLVSAPAAGQAEDWTTQFDLITPETLAAYLKEQSAAPSAPAP